MLALTNVSDREQAVAYSTEEIGIPSPLWRDLLSEKGVGMNGGRLEARLAPYEVLWLTPES
ncbi:MAG: hypothetical protein L0212_08600 [Acidobacteria bacterium]|nr:hypothetical protein [Acidobacteriota bacterium]